MTIAAAGLLLSHGAGTALQREAGKKLDDECSAVRTSLETVVLEILGRLEYLADHGVMKHSSAAGEVL